MLYHAYQAWSDLFEPSRLAALWGLGGRERLNGGEWPWSRRLFALMDMKAHWRVTHDRPDYRIRTVLSGNREVAVRERVVLSLPFCNLIRFVKDEEAPKPKMLVVAPLSGHFATLLRNTIATLLKDHDVYVTDWLNARDVPVGEGRFGFDDYVDYLIRCLEHLGPGGNVLAVCQPCVQTLVAVAIMAEDKNPAQPRTMTLMGGPIDTRVSPTVVNDLSVQKSLRWFKDSLISEVPGRWRGAGRRVYPGFLQLAAFMSMNMARHSAQQRAYYQHLADGDGEKAQLIREFYDEYFAVLDMTEEFYLETVDRIFQQALLPRRKLEWRGRLVNTRAIQKTALLTVEGERDDICAVGQTAAAHDLCSSLRPHLKRHHLQPGAGHYGIFSGRKWEQQIYPQVRTLVLAMS